MNKQLLITCLRETVKLLELHGANPFQVRHYQRAALEIARVVSWQDLSKILRDETYLSAATRKLLAEMLQTGSLKRRDELLSNTPPGLLDMMTLRTLGPKRAAVLWKSLGISNAAALEEACLTGKVAALAGFGEKTQAALLHSIDFQKRHVGQWRYDVADQCAAVLEEALKEQFPKVLISRAGALRRCVETVDGLSWVVGGSHRQVVVSWLQNAANLRSVSSQPDVWRGVCAAYDIPVTVWLCARDAFFVQLFLRTGSAKHMALPTHTAEVTLSQAVKSMSKVSMGSEAALYEAAGYAWVPPELREGLLERPWMKKERSDRLVESQDLRGVFHVHTTYSDGRCSLQAMAEHCVTLGYDYLGVADHSQRAVYAGGMSPETLEIQHREIERLNRVMAPFRIFKGAEVDILSDGQLDYAQDILATLDFVVASVHTDLGMGRAEATRRLIKAIEHPATTFIGHVSNRLLLKREGLPLDYKAVIDACAACNVVLELNANPYRLELDWRWIDYALCCGVRIGINPDAHDASAIEHVRYGVQMARKGGLTPEHTFNALSAQQVASYFQKKRNPKAL